MAKLTARIDGVVYELSDSEGTDLRAVAEKWAQFAKQGTWTWLITDARTRVWVNWARVTSFEVSEASPY
jgi:hypothetical protein